MPPLNSKLITCNQTTLLYMKKLKKQKMYCYKYLAGEKKAKVNNLNHPFFSIVREYIYKKNKVKKNLLALSPKNFFLLLFS